MHCRGQGAAFPATVGTLAVQSASRGRQCDSPQAQSRAVATWGADPPPLQSSSPSLLPHYWCGRSAACKQGHVKRLNHNPHVPGKFYTATQGTSRQVIHQLCLEISQLEDVAARWVLGLISVSREGTQGLSRVPLRSLAIIPWRGVEIHGNSMLGSSLQTSDVRRRCSERDN